MKQVRVGLVDDQGLFREGVRTLLELQPDMLVVGEAADGRSGVELVKTCRPDVVLMDLHMPVSSGVEATREICTLPEPPRVLVLTTFDEDQEVFSALRAGAFGYLLKASPAAVLYEAIRAAARGESTLNPSVAAKVVAEFARLSLQKDVPPPPSRPTWFEGLSNRETEVLKGLSEGRSNKEIGTMLGIAEGTVKNHMSSVLSKLGALDRTQAALRAREWGLI